MTVVDYGGSIHRLEIENFKSYKGNQVVGPFKGFTAIIGPNGAGKSNLMDAISFVLGVKSMQLRGSQLRDLIYSFDDSEREQRGRRGHVKLVYLTKSGEELHFMRGITSAGSSEYRINGQVVTWDVYNGNMKSLGILVRARNFLVFQGDVESVASKTPKEFTTLFEQISGSEELKKDYEQLEEQKGSAEERVAFNYQRRKGIAAERKQKKEQKEEAENHLELKKELKELKTEYFLWSLYVIDRDLAAAKADVEDSYRQLEEVTAAVVENQSSVNEKKSEQAAIYAELTSWERKAGKKLAAVEKMKPDIVKLKEELKRLHTQIEKSELDLKSKQKLAERHATNISSLQASLKKVTEELEDTTAQGPSSEKLLLAESQMEEYSKMKEEAGKKTSRVRQEKDGFSRLQQSDMDTLIAMENDVKEIESRVASINSQLEQVVARQEKSSEALDQGRADVASLREQDRKTREKQRKLRNRAESYQVKLQDVERQLRDMKADKRESDRDIKMRETLSNLKRLFPGVQGRMSELCKPREKKYNLAVSIVMGKMMDAIVVDEEKTGKECIEFLREQREPPMMFIPLQTVRVKPVQERLRSLSGSAKLLLDVIQFEKSFEVAMLYSVGNTLVCDSVEEAKALAWGNERHKVVALDGTLLSKGGAMTGGISGSMESKSSRWDEKAIEALKDERERLQRELEQVPSKRDIQMYDSDFASKLSILERKIAYAEMEMKMSGQRKAELEQELASLIAGKERDAPKLLQLKESMEARGARVQRLEERIHEIEDRIFRDFSAAVGVANIREYEENRLKEVQEMAQRKLQLSSKKAKIENQLQFEIRKDMVGPVEALQTKIGSLKDRMARVREDASEAKDKQEALNAELLELQRECAERKAMAEAVEKEVQDLKKEGSGLVNRIGKLKRDIGAMEAQIEQLTTRRSAVLENCELEQISLKTVDGDSVAMDIDSGGPVARETSFDYSRLKERYKREMRPADKERLEADFKSRLEDLSSEIERTAPNLKALEQYDALREKERESVDEFEAARKEAKELTDKFNALKQERYTRFMDAFQHISSSINQIYKELTMSSTHPLGGTAYLALENEDEPFLGGIRYTAMPPTKRFRDMEQLSGGEKTVAALALLFSIHSFQPSPFFVLDEVDAALDNLNVAKVAAYIRNKSRGNSSDDSAQGFGFQGVVISLKDQFYDKADALVGVYRDTEMGCSRTLTFDLTKFPV